MSCSSNYKKMHETIGTVAGQAGATVNQGETISPDNIRRLYQMAKDTVSESPTDENRSRQVAQTAMLVSLSRHKNLPKDVLDEMVADANSAHKGIANMAYYLALRDDLSPQQAVTLRSHPNNRVRKAAWRNPHVTSSEDIEAGFWGESGKPEHLGMLQNPNTSPFIIDMLIGEDDVDVEYYYAALTNPELRPEEQRSLARNVPAEMLEDVLGYHRGLDDSARVIVEARIKDRDRVIKAKIFLRLCLQKRLVIRRFCV